MHVVRHEKSFACLSVFIQFSLSSHARTVCESEPQWLLLNDLAEMDIGEWTRAYVSQRLRDTHVADESHKQEIQLMEIKAEDRN